MGGLADEIPPYFSSNSLEGVLTPTIYPKKSLFPFL